MHQTAKNSSQALIKFSRLDPEPKASSPNPKIKLLNVPLWEWQSPTIRGDVLHIRTQVSEIATGLEPIYGRLGESTCTLQHARSQFLDPGAEACALCKSPDIFLADMLCQVAGCRSGVSICKNRDGLDPCYQDPKPHRPWTKLYQAFAASGERATTHYPC